MVKIDDFLKLELKVGTVLEAEEIEGADKLLKLKVDFGPLSSVETDSTQPVALNDGGEKAQNDIRQILSGIKQWYKPEDLTGKQFVFITNLEPRTMMGLESQGMILAAGGGEKPVPLIPRENVPNGSKIR